MRYKGDEPTDAFSQTDNVSQLEHNCWAGMQEIGTTYLYTSEA
jgi:hypothetical protein